jgi:histidinol dehydrogenase
MSGLRYRGRLALLDAAARQALFARGARAAAVEVAKTVREIIERVRDEGDAALFELSRRYDGVSPEALEVDDDAIQAALGRIDRDVVAALERAERNLRTAHGMSLPQPCEIETEPGVTIGRRPDPLAAAGVYAPGGRAAYPSSVLMGVVPARVAGVREIVVCSPPGPAGAPSDIVLAAAAIAGATRVFALGGAQAIAALAFGTATIPGVDRIVGPGNAYVAEAKRQVAGFVGIDAPAGPSEILAIADDSADPEHIARELIAQAEHDPDAAVVALAVGDRLAAKITEAVEMSTRVRTDVVARSLAARGAVLAIDSVEEAWPFAEAFAAEHVLLAVREPERALANVRNAGTVFFGDGSSVAFGDYMTGANHVLPTAGAARSFSGLSTGDFVRWTSWQHVDRAAAATMALATSTLARAEGLLAHAEAANAFAGGKS